jgi:hypothetical protein
MDIVIAYPTRTNMVQQASMTTSHVTMMVIQEKTRSYSKWAPGNDFIPLAIETYECFYFYFYLFCTACAQTTIAHH